MNRMLCGRRVVAGLSVLAAFVALIAAPLTAAQAPAAASSDAVETLSPEQLEQLVGPIALYPDDLVALILPASTNPLQLVQADRFLEKRKTDPKLAIDDRWDDSVKTLLNYPEVVKQMSSDLDWTADLGEAVVADQGGVLDAVQAFRRKAQAAGNLKTDPKQVVEVDKQIITIVPADPQVIYVPQYNPATVVVYSSAPVYGYYPAPYPSYYYPYPPGAALATGLIWGAAIGAAWNGGRWNTHWGGGYNNNITINRGDVNINRGNINTGNINRGNAGNRPSQGGTAWQSNKRPGQVSSAAGRPANTARVGDSRPGGFGGGAAASTRPAGGGGAGTRPSTPAGGGMGQGANASRGQMGGANVSGAATRNGAGGGGQGAFGGYGSGGAARADSSRGAASRSSMPSQGARSSAGGGGARASGGGGARAGGGGGGGRGGRR